MTASYPSGLLDFYFYGFLRILRRYIAMTAMGWIIVLLGVVSLTIGWRFGQYHGLLDVVLAAAVVLSGLLVVQQAVKSLETYTEVNLAGLIPGADTPFVHDVEQIMKDVGDGGWFEARNAVDRLLKIGEAYGVTEKGSSGH